MDWTLALTRNAPQWEEEQMAPVMCHQASLQRWLFISNLPSSLPPRNTSINVIKAGFGVGGGGTSIISLSCVHAAANQSNRQHISVRAPSLISVLDIRLLKVNIWFEPPEPDSSCPL